MKILSALMLCLTGCAMLGREPGDRAELNAVAADVLHQLDLEAGFTWVGLRDASGKETEATQAVEEYLISSLVRRGLPFSVVPSEESSWSGEAIPPGERVGPVLGGRLVEDGAWMYVRLYRVEGVGGRIVQAAARGVAKRHVDDEVAQRARASGTGRDGLPIEVDVHWVALRREGDIRRPVRLVEGESLQEGDELQIRFRLNRDAQVYAFLFSSEGEVISLVPDEFRYSGLPYYGPGENSWVTLSESDRVYTAYFMVGPRLLEENASEFFERLDELVEQRQVDRFVGLDRQDEIVVEFLRRSFPGGIPIEVVRGNEALVEGRSETLVYSDGTRLQSVAEKWVAPLIVRAVSFSVQ